jgi:hypothetical protein
MAPEVLQKGAMAMPADVYSFAMLMLELWTGEIVYCGINSHQVDSSPISFCGQRTGISDLGGFRNGLAMTSQPIQRRIE